MWQLIRIYIMYIYMYAHTYACTYIHMHDVYIYIHMYLHIYKHIHIYTHILTRLHDHPDSIIINGICSQFYYIINTQCSGAVTPNWVWPGLRVLCSILHHAALQSPSAGYGCRHRQVSARCMKGGEWVWVCRWTTVNTRRAKPRNSRKLFICENLTIYI